MTEGGHFQSETGHGSVIMMSNSKQSGFEYAKKILADSDLAGLVFWLGFRSFNEDELSTLIESSDEKIELALQKLRQNGVVNPIKDDQEKWTLTNDGDDLRNMLISLSVWSRQQMDNQEEIIPELIVEPERVANLKELVKFRDGVVRKYMNI